MVSGTQLLEDADSVLLVLLAAQYFVSLTNISKNNVLIADGMKGLLRDAKLSHRQFILLRRLFIRRKS